MEEKVQLRFTPSFNYLNLLPLINIMPQMTLPFRAPFFLDSCCLGIILPLESQTLIPTVLVLYQVAVTGLH